MVDKAIQNYIDTNKAKGYSAGQLYTALVGQGYSAGDVAEALRPHHQAEKKHRLQGKGLIIIGVLVVLLLIGAGFFVVSMFSTSTVEVDREEVKERIGVISSRSQATRAVAPIVIEDEDPCSGITCREGEKCFEGQCFRKSCAELGGGVCGGGSSCSGTSVVGSDTTACCVGRCVVDDLCADVTCESGKECRDGVCEALSCSEQGGVQCSTEQLCVGRLGADCCTSCNERADSCAGVTCGSNEECEAGQCILLSCEALGGELCSNEQTCINELVASDGGICCEDACEDPAGGGNEGLGGGSDENNGSSVKEFDIVARKFEFDPSTIEVDVGDSVLFRVTSEDVSHGIVISEFGVDEFLAPGDEVEIAFEADRAGEFDIFCSVFCGSGHGGMTGTLIVR